MGLRTYSPCSMFSNCQLLAYHKLPKGTVQPKASSACRRRGWKGKKVKLALAPILPSAHHHHCPGMPGTLPHNKPASGTKTWAEGYQVPLGRRSFLMLLSLSREPAPHIKLNWQVSTKQAERESQRKDTSNRNAIMQWFILCMLAHWEEGGRKIEGTGLFWGGFFGRGRNTEEDNSEEWFKEDIGGYIARIKGSETTPWFCVSDTDLCFYSVQQRLYWDHRLRELAGIYNPILSSWFSLSVALNFMKHRSIHQPEGKSVGREFS